MQSERRQRGPAPASTLAPGSFQHTFGKHSVLQRKIVCWYGHRERCRRRCRRKEKRPSFHAASWNFPNTTGVRLMNYFGGSVALGSAGLGVVGLGVVAPAPGLGLAGFAAPVVGGAGTPGLTLCGV